MSSIFAPYMKVKDPHKAHAVLSASGSERWLGCPASVRLCDGIPSVDNEHGIRGTNTHTLIQFILEHTDWADLLRSPAARKFKAFIGFDAEMLASALVAVDYVKAEKKRMYLETGIKPKLFIEQKVELEGVGFGTSDIILYQPFGVLHVMDFKNGRYKVDPEYNTQGLYYSVAAADLFGWDFREVWITIIQPNSPNKRGPIRTWKTTPRALERAKRQLVAGAKRTKDPKAPVVPDSKYCWFCPAREKGCPAQVENKRVKIAERFTR